MNLGKLVKTQSQFIVNPNILLRGHTFISSITGSGKTSMILKIIEELRTENFLKKYPYIQIVILDYGEEFIKIPEQYNDFTLISNKHNGEIFTVEDASAIGKNVREIGMSLVVKLKDLTDTKEQEDFIAKFIEGLRSVKTEQQKPCFLVIDEADIFVPSRMKRSNVSSRNVIIEACKRARKEGISIILATQRLTEVDLSARSQCTNRAIGKAVENDDRKQACQMLGDKSIFDSLWNLKAGQFYVRGDAFSEKVELIQMEESRIDRPHVGISIEEVMTHNGVYEKRLKTALNSGLEFSDLEKLQRRYNHLKLLYDVAIKNQATPEMKQEIYNMGHKDGYNKAKQEEIENMPKKESRFSFLKGKKWNQ